MFILYQTHTYVLESHKPSPPGVKLITEFVAATVMKISSIQPLAPLVGENMKTVSFPPA